MSKNLLDGPKEYEKEIEGLDKILYQILDDIKKQTIFLSSQNVDRLISLGEVVGDDWEIIQNERCDEITFSESDLNLIELAQAPKTSNKKSKQDTSLFKVRYQYAGSKKGERDFCNKVIEADKVYREEDLNANYNYNEELSPSGTDSYNIFLFKGGVNCKHWWQRVVYLKKGNDRISVNQARKMILELDPKDRKEASFDKNDKRVAQVAEAQNNYWSLTPDYRDSGVELSAKSKELYQRLAGFDPSQKRGADGKWGSEGNKVLVESDLQKEFKDLKIDLYQDDKRKTLTLSRVIVPEDLRNQGIGTKFMNSLTDKADKLKYKIILTPAEDFGGSRKRLIEFYKSFGFVFNKGENRDFSHKEDMYRLPKDEVKLAGFDPNQKRGEDGKWGSEGGPKELTENQKKCINDYTNTGFFNINKYLGTGKVFRHLDAANEQTEDEIKGGIKCLKNALSDLPNYEGKTYRGDTIKIKNLDDFKNNLDNNYLEFKSFLSTTRDSNQAQIFGGLTRKNEYPVIYNITSKKGKFISDYSKFKEEKEVLFMPNTRFNVLDWTDFNGRLVVDLIEI